LHATPKARFKGAAEDDPLLLDEPEDEPDEEEEADFTERALLTA